MSYILDALRKADAQRERDPARGIHAQPVRTSTLEWPQGHQRRFWLWGGTAVFGVVLLAVAVWLMARPDAMSPVALAPTAGVGSPSLPAPTLPLVVPVKVQAQPATEVLPAPPPPQPARAAAAAPAVVPFHEAGKAAPGLVTSPPAPATAASDRVLSVSELPADVQRELPRLAISGGVYSDNPAQRILIVNGLVLGEGAEPAPGVVLEKIRVRTAVLRYRGYRYALAY